MKEPDKEADYVSSDKLSRRNFPSSKEQLLGRNALLEKEVALVHNQGLALAHFFAKCTVLSLNVENIFTFDKLALFDQVSCQASDSQKDEFQSRCITFALLSVFTRGCIGRVVKGFLFRFCKIHSHRLGRIVGILPNSSLIFD